MPEATSPPLETAPELAAPERVVVADGVARGAGLSARMRAATRALAETLFTGDAGPPSAERLDWLCDDLDHFLCHAGPRARRLYALCLFAISVLGPLHVARLPPFRRLSQQQRARALERMERGAFSLAVFGAKAILCILYFEHPGPAREIGFDGACLVSEANPRPAGAINLIERGGA